MNSSFVENLESWKFVVNDTKKYIFLNEFLGLKYYMLLCVVQSLNYVRI